jgi:hypothetical protein
VDQREGETGKQDAGHGGAPNEGFGTNYDAERDSRQITQPRHSA